MTEIEVAFHQLGPDQFRLTRIETEGEMARMDVLAEQPDGALMSWLLDNAVTLDEGYAKALATQRRSNDLDED